MPLTIATRLAAVTQLAEVLVKVMLVGMAAVLALIFTICCTHIAVILEYIPAAMALKKRPRSASLPTS